MRVLIIAFGIYFWIWIFRIHFLISKIHFRIKFLEHIFEFHKFFSAMHFHILCSRLNFWNTFFNKNSEIFFLKCIFQICCFGFGFSKHIFEFWKFFPGIHVQILCYGFSFSKCIFFYFRFPFSERDFEFWIIFLEFQIG